jgi:Acyl-coenzyme A:6-aminopenicillanic acid acyl-transferase.
VTLQDCGTHFDVVLNLENGATHRQIGEEYGELLAAHVPQFEKELDSYITEFARNWFIYKIGLRRVGQIKPQLSQEYKDEIEGIASRLTGGTTNALGDGKISKDELYLYNLLGDVARLFQCSALAVYGESSSSGQTIVGRNFDWPPGKKNQLSQVQSVVTVKNGDKSIVNVACLGFQGAVTAFNRYGVFASVNDSPTGAHYSAKKRRSYLLDLRQALEENRTVDGVAKFMTDRDKLYSCNHLITLAETDKAVVLENNVGRKKGEPVRAIRASESQMHDDVTWGIPDSVGCVNCFRLKFADDNRMSAFHKKKLKRDPNSGRWESLKQQLKQHGPKVTVDGVKEILSYHHPHTASIYKGDIYNKFTVQSVVFQPGSLKLNVAFRRRDGIMHPQLSFVEVPVKLQPIVSAARLPSVVSNGGPCQHE